MTAMVPADPSARDPSDPRVRALDELNSQLFDCSEVCQLVSL